MQQYIKLKLTIGKLTVKIHKATVRQTNRNTEIKRVCSIGCVKKAVDSDGLGNPKSHKLFELAMH